MVRLSQFSLSQFIFFRKLQWKQSIELKRFTNSNLDTVGWYALGHYNDKVFLAIVDRKEPLHMPFYEIRRVWTKWEGSQLQETRFSAPNAKSITIIEFSD